MGPGSVFAAHLDHLLLLHLEGSQVHRQGEIILESGSVPSRAGCVLKG